MDEDLKEIWDQRALCEHAYSVNSAERWFYTIKGTICYWLHLETKKSYPDLIHLALYDFHGPVDYEYGGKGWTAFGVGVGVFSNWFYRIYSDSSI